MRSGSPSVRLFGFPRFFFHSRILREAEAVFVLHTVQVGEEKRRPVQPGRAETKVQIRGEFFYFSRCLYFVSGGGGRSGGLRAIYEGKRTKKWRRK